MLRHKWLLNRGGSQKGFTLVEALVAVIVVGILITSLTPLIVFSVAARVQARRVDLATQAGRSYIEAVRSGAISVADLPPELILTNPNDTTFNTIAAPNPATYSPPPGTEIDGNANGTLGDTFDLIIQPMRTRIIVNPPGPEPASLEARETALRNQGYYVGVRVYRADAFGSAFSPTLYRGLIDPQCATSRGVFIGSLGNRACPIVVMRAEIFPSTTNTSEIRRRLGN